MNADLLLLSGKYDSVWPSTEMANRVVERLDRHAYAHHYRHEASAAGHDVFWISWPDVVAFLREYYPPNDEAVQ